MDNNVQDAVWEQAKALEDAERYEEAFALYLPLAEAGHISSMTDVARYYDDGYGVKPDFELGIEWAEKAIAAGDVTAMTCLAVTYRRIGDIRKSKALFEQALAVGDLGAALELAKLYLVSDKETETVIKYLKIVLAGEPFVSKDEFEEAEALLAEIEGRGVVHI